jgi:SagB-type dehydrogenase family enzyme
MLRPTGSTLRRCKIDVAAIVLLLLVMFDQHASSESKNEPSERSGGAIALPAPRVAGEVSVEQALAQRRSLRRFAHTPLSLPAVSQLLWAAQGITHPDGLRTAPSAGALYPLEVYLVAGAVTGIDPGVYRYEPERHRLVPGLEGDVRVGVARAALGQDWISEAPAILVLGAVYERTARKYRERTARYVHIESGHAAQNVYLQAEALGLGTTIVGAFHDDDLSLVVGMSGRVKPLALLPVGRPR